MSGADSAGVAPVCRYRERLQLRQLKADLLVLLSEACASSYSARLRAQASIEVVVVCREHLICPSGSPGCCMQRCSLLLHCNSFSQTGSVATDCCTSAPQECAGREMCLICSSDSFMAAELGNARPCGFRQIHPRARAERELSSNCPTAPRHPAIFLGDHCSSYGGIRRSHRVKHHPSRAGT